MSSIKRENLNLGAPYEEPAGKLEESLAKLFSEALNIDRVGANDDFFDLGGDSLLAESLSLAISMHTGRDFRISSLAYHSTPRKVAALIQSDGEPNPPHIGIEVASIPIFAVPGRLGFMLPRKTFLDGLNPGQKFRMFELPGVRGTNQPLTHIEDIAENYVTELTGEYPGGPVLLAGFCAGSIIAIEMTARLAALKRPVRQLVLFDPNITPECVLNYLHHSRAVAGGVDESSLQIKTSLTSRLLCFLALKRWTDGSLDEDITDERLRRIRERYIKYRFWRRRFIGRSFGLENKYPGLALSTDAQAKLLAAYHHYRPRRFDGPVTLLASARRKKRFEGDSLEARFWGDLLPQLKVRVVGRTHSETIGANSSEPAQIMQSIFDDAVNSLSSRA